MNDEYEWDEEKRRENAYKHTIDFTEIHAFEWDTALYNSNDTHDELRWVVTSYIHDRLYTVVYTERSNRKRIISLRRASKREERDYAQA
jgi:uncharacterized DUF497 family protein